MESTLIPRQIIRGILPQRREEPHDLPASILLPAGLRVSPEENPAGSLNGVFPIVTSGVQPRTRLRRSLFQEMPVNFAKAAAEHRLVAIDYFAWNSDPWSKQPDADSSTGVVGRPKAGGWQWPG